MPPLQCDASQAQTRARAGTLANRAESQGVATPPTTIPRQQDAGFAIGRHVKIEGKEGRMTIEQVD
jgi:hypothetical protein